jgi:hypothetical protein
MGKALSDLLLNSCRQLLSWAFVTNDHYGPFTQFARGYRAPPSNNLARFLLNQAESAHYNCDDSKASGEGEEPLANCEDSPFTNRHRWLASRDGRQGIHPELEKRLDKLGCVSISQRASDPYRTHVWTHAGIRNNAT